MVRKIKPPAGQAGGSIAVRLLLPENAPEFIYGVITIGAVMAAESGAHETYAETFASALVATVLYWLARAYTDLLGHRLATGERLMARALGRELLADWAIVRGASLPLLGLLIAWIAGAGQETGVTVALYTAVATIVLFELVAGIRSRSTPRELLFKTGVGVAMGLAILAMKGILR
jgi:membrane protein YqaA with SNARE-associated domain